MIYAEDITGNWFGTLNVQGVKLRLVFHIVKKGETYKATMDSLDQGAKGIPVSSVGLKDSKIKIMISSAGILFEGLLKDKNTITGTFKQSGLVLPLKLIRKKGKTAELKRPQEPKKPYPYYSENVKFENRKDKITLAGTLTFPKKGDKFPAVILITGSGPQNRDEEILGHKPFLIISDFLTKHGIAVLRFDDRGVGKSTGDFKTATTLDFVKDVESAIEYLKTRKEIDKNRIGLIGHSEGGIIAPIVASERKDSDFIILLAGTGIRGDKLLLMQTKAILKASGVDDKKIDKELSISKGAFDIVLNINNKNKMIETLKKYFKKIVLKSDIPKGMKKDDFINLQIRKLTSPWLLFFIRYNPVSALVKVKCPVLALNGEKDLQVPAKENLKAIKNALLKGGNKKITIKEIPGLNHLFQECKTGLPTEYGKIEQTFSPKVLKIITDWILSQKK
jgi:fermentation-respiration switch protein FrsA (DUF1100 family)